MAITILVLAAALQETSEKTREYPLCLTEFNNTSLLETIVNKTSTLRDAVYIFAFLKTELEKFHLNSIVKILSKGSKSVSISIPDSTLGAACTALFSTTQTECSGELLIICANELVEINYKDVVEDFRERKLEGGLVTFKSIHPRYSYVCLDDENLVVEAAQQNPISNNATAGVFWFSEIKNFNSAAMNMIRKNTNINGKYYIAPVYNEMILKGCRIGVKEIDKSQYFPLKTEQQLKYFKQGKQ